jgi:mono/diheme cytochrome c family protein
MKRSLTKTTALASLLMVPLAGAAMAKDAVVTLWQGWDEAARSTFYHAPQGSPILPYNFFMALEQPSSEMLFIDKEHLASLGMLYWGASALNPDDLPIGLTVDRDIHGNEPYLGMNCAACHVTEVKVGGKTVLVDGGVSHFDFWRFMQTLLAALEETHKDSAKFDRFAKRLLGDDYNAEAADQLRARLRGVVAKRQEWAFHNQTSTIPGPGRVDALNVILNQVTAKMLERDDNARLADGPVSYPYLWDAPYLQYVQYNGVVPNEGAGALGRNVGQVLGVFGQVSLQESTIPGGYASSVRIEHLHDLENTLETLLSPQWSELAGKGLVPQIDQTLASQGETLFKGECASCHQVIDRVNRGALASIPIKTFGLPEIGTDPAAAMGFAARAVASGPLQGRKAAYIEGDPLCEYVHGNTVLAHVTVGVIMHDFGHTYKDVLSTIGGQAKDSLRQKFHDIANSVKATFGFGTQVVTKAELTDRQVIDSLREKGKSEAEIVEVLKARSTDQTALYDLMVKQGMLYNGKDADCLETLETAQYRSRPLNGVWATGPFLHNGSVATLRDLLEPPEKRKKQFVVGNSDFDPVNLGFVEPADGDGHVFDTTLPGNSNSGHVFGTHLPEDSKRAIIEYLKTL